MLEKSLNIIRDKGGISALNIKCYLKKTLTLNVDMFDEPVGFVKFCAVAVDKVTNKASR
jgi:hypothetical protein